MGKDQTSGVAHHPTVLLASFDKPACLRGYIRGDEFIPALHLREVAERAVEDHAWIHIPRGVHEDVSASGLAM